MSTVAASEQAVLNQSPSPTKLHTLSGFRLEHTNFTRPKPLVLLAYLCLEGRQDRRFLAELFWPGASNHLNSLNKALSSLRQLGVIENDDTHVWSVVTSDANEFLSALEAHDLERATALYQDSFLSGVYLPDWGAELEEWVYATREFLAARAREVLLELAERSDDVKAATGYAERAYELAAPLEPDLIPRLYKLLANTSYGVKLKQEAQDFGISLEQPKALKSNLPARGTSFIGRDMERLELAELLGQNDVRMVTVVGQGGVGKTSLALEVARELQDTFADGVVYWPLETLSTPEQILEGLARALSLELKKVECIEQIIAVVAHRRVLLVLDNVEHLLEQLDRISRLLQKCPNLKILVTSRVRLNLDEEWVYALEGFSVPAKTTRLEEAQHHDAVALFVGRARKVRPGFALDEDSLPFVLEICERVGGLPLGIELAASWVKVLSPREIAGQLEAADLSTSLSNVPERHRSLRHVFEGSWHLLSEEEQTVLAKLSVFQGGFSREAAREVTGATLLLLARLVDKSLLRLVSSRYEFHPLVQQFVREKLITQGQENEPCARHANYFLRLAEAAKPHLETNEQKAWLLRLEEDLGNLRAAFSWFLSSEATRSSALKLVSALGVFFRSYGHTRQGGIWLQEALQVNQEPSRERAEVLHAAAILFRLHGEYDKAREHFQECLALWRRLHDKDEEALALGDLAILFTKQGDYAAAAAHYELALAHLRGTNDHRMLAIETHNLGDLHHTQGHLEQARLHFEEGLRLFRKVDLEFGIAHSLTALAAVAFDQQDYLSACQYCQESLNMLRGSVPKVVLLTETLVLAGKIAHALGKKEEAHAFVRESLELSKGIENTSSLILGLEGLAVLHLPDDPKLAVRLLATAEAARTTARFVRARGDQALFESALTEARAALGETAFAVAWTLGQATALEQAATSIVQQPVPQ